ncbi:MAG: thiamine ABC transporter substrate-binding protein [Treponemataceae bacterium]|nr:MAG: thiamine ABC transporter substrate-binding protein [Treponemataceae bacterium]
MRIAVIRAKTLDILGVSGYIEVNTGVRVIARQGAVNAEKTPEGRTHVCPNLIRIIPAEGVMKHFKLFIIFLALVAVVGCSKRSHDGPAADGSPADRSGRANEVVVYAYDSFVSEWGPGPALEELFTAQTGYKLTFISAGDAVQVLSRAEMEKNAPQADVILGVDNNLLARAKQAGVAESYKPQSASDIPAHLILDPDWQFVPFDWSYFAFIYDSESASRVTPPASLEDLTKSEYAKKIILMDPRASTPGLGFASWTVAALGENYLDYWQALKPNILTMAPGWSSGYGLFTEGEAPLVISYTTSPPYHVEYDKTSRYKALIFEQGHPMQVEFAAVVKGAPNKQGAQAFVDFLLSVDAQNALPLTQWMYPANKNAALPQSFSAGGTFLPANAAVTKTLSADPLITAKAVDEIMRLLAE